jgi:hypothetical protein
MKRRHSGRGFRQDLKFYGGVIGVACVVAVGVGILTQGVDGMLARVDLAYKALSNPGALNTKDKSEIKKMLAGDKNQLKAQYDKMSAAQKAQVKSQFNELDEDEKKRLKQMFGK